MCNLPRPSWGRGIAVRMGRAWMDSARCYFMIALVTGLIPRSPALQPFMASVRSFSARAPRRKHKHSAHPGPLPDQRLRVEKLWREFFSRPCRWWDRRLKKVSRTDPDFKHKKKPQTLWLDSNLNPPWVELELAAMTPEAFHASIFSWNERLKRYVQAGSCGKAMELFQQMQREGVKPNRYTFVPVLNACCKLRDLEQGRLIHKQIMKAGHESDAYVGTSLINMYAKCGSIGDARMVFNKLPARGVVAWNTMIRGYVKCQEGRKALELFPQMQRDGVDPESITFVGLLNACTSVGALEEGRHIHKLIIDRGFQSDTYVGNCLVDMYAKCGSINDARRVFNKMPSRDVVAWTALIRGYVKCGRGQEALELSRQMRREGVNPDPLTFVGLLNVCASVASLEEGRLVHEQIIEKGYDSDIFVGSGLVDMYAKCGSIEDARQVFNKMPHRDVVAWNAMILGYVKCREGQEAWELLRQMQVEGVDPSPVTFVGLLNTCVSASALEKGRLVHEQVIARGYESDVFVGSSLVDMYAKCGSIEDAWQVFNKMPIRDVVAWGAMIIGYVKCGEGKKALKLYEQMQLEGVDPNPVTFVGVLNACASTMALEGGRHVHEQITERGFELDVFVGSSLVDMYAKCGSIDDARQVFNKMPNRDVVAWNAMILGYVKCGESQKALEVSQQMQQEGLNPDRVTFLGLLNVCGSLMAVEEGRRVHEQIIERGYESDVYLGNSLVDMYVKCGSIEDARTVFNKMPCPDVLAWNALILGYVKCGEVQQALELSRQMQQEGIETPPAIFVGMLNACASVAALEEGRHVHEQIIKKGCESDVYVQSSLIDMYAKCGSLEDALQVFNKLPTRDVVAWNAMLAGYGTHGNGRDALQHFKLMWKVVEVDDITFTCLLAACSHGGLVDEGLCYFESMSALYNILPTVEHYSCVVDILARAGRLHEAEDMIQTMPCEPGVSVWRALLGACKTHRNMEMGERVAKPVMELVPNHAAGYVLLSNLYATVGMGNENAKIDQVRSDRHVQKILGC